MLHELRIHNLLLIEQAELRLGPGLNAITGETGAGKTILAHSLDLLMGGRARPQIVQPGAEEAYVEGAFALPPGLLEDPDLADLAARLPAGADEITLARRVGASGRTSAFIQGRSASAADLSALGSRLLAFYGQHEHRKLTLASAQGEVLDAFAGAEHLEARRRYRDAHAEVGLVGRGLDELREREGARERDLDLLRFELAEIEAAEPDPGEEAELEQERRRLRHAEALRLAAALALAAIAGDDDDSGSAAPGASSMVAEAEAALRGEQGVDSALDSLGERAGALAVELGDLASELRGYLERLEADPERLAAIEERAAALDRLKRKHGGTLEAVLAHAEGCRAEIERLRNADEMCAELERALARAQAERAELAAELTAGRRRAASELATGVAAELERLAMPGATLEVTLEEHPDGFGPGGAETVELRVATNPGLAPAPLRDAASGGELSRVMLALIGLSRSSETSALVFDEIDAGIGGSTARIVGERLQRLGEGRQVICITHLPQVAALAATHFRIEKHAAGGETRATVERVEGEELVAEICRMLGAGLDDKAASRHARELLRAA